MKTQYNINYAARYLSIILATVCLLAQNLNFASTIDFCNIKFQVIQNNNNNKHLLWLHGNEKDAKNIIIHHINQNPGKAFLIQNNQRLIKINGYKLDPNRIFSDTGIQETLIKNNRQIMNKQINKIVTLIKQQRASFLKQILPTRNGVLITLHNNQFNYSVFSELKNSTDTSIKHNQSPHNFFLCTSKEDFNVLKNSPYNVVLQSYIRATDDGSLSHLMAREKRRYINIEARLGSRKIQSSMLNYVEQHIFSHD